MQKNRNKYLAIALGLMIVSSIGLLFLTREEPKSEIDHNHFRLAESEKIDQVILSSPRGKINLKFDGAHWRVNEKWDTDLQMIKLLFATLQQAEPRRPVAASMKDSVNRILSTKGTQILLIENGASKVNFLAGGNSIKTETWFLKEGETQPYVMQIPGYRVYVAGVLELDESGWRSKRIFDFYWRNFKSLTASYAREPKQSLEIEMKDHYFGLKDVASVDTTKLNDYLDAVSFLSATKFIPPGLPEIDSLMATAPAIRIEVKDIANRVYVLELFTPRKQDIEVYGRLADGQIVALEKNRIGEIARRKDFFRPAGAR